MNIVIRSAAVALASFLAPFASAQDCKPVNGHFELAIVPPGVGHCPAAAGSLCSAGRIWGGINGQSQFIVTSIVPAAAIGGIPTALFSTGHATLHLQDGTTVVGTDSGALDPPPGQGAFASLISFTSGATGQIRLFGVFTDAPGTAGEYEGHICR